MNKARWVSAAVGTAVLSAGFALPGMTAAYADSGPNGNSGVLSILSGNNVNAPVSVPVNTCGISLAILGFSDSGCQGGAASSTATGSPGSGGGNGNAGSTAIGSGNTVNAPVSAPVNTCGISVATGGFSNSGCKGGSASDTTIGGSSGGGNGNAGSTAIGSGNTVNAPVSAPSNVCGIALALLGFSDAGCQGGSANDTTIGNGSSTGGSGGGNGNAGVLSSGSGNTVNAPVSTPVNACGISLADLGFANSGCQGGAASSITTGSSGSGGGNGNGGVISTGSGNTVNTPVSAPVNTCGISLAMLGFSDSGCQGGSVSVVNPPPGGGTPPGGGGTPPGAAGTPPGSGGGTPPGGGIPLGNGAPPGSQGGGTTTTVPGSSLPITGADLLGMAAAAVGALGIGGASLVIARRRRNSEI